MAARLCCVTSCSQLSISCCAQTPCPALTGSTLPTFDPTPTLTMSPRSTPVSRLRHCPASSAAGIHPSHGRTCGQLGLRRVEPLATLPGDRSGRRQSRGSGSVLAIDLLRRATAERHPRTACGNRSRAVSARAAAQHGSTAAGLASSCRAFPVASPDSQRSTARVLAAHHTDSSTPPPLPGDRRAHIRP